MKRTYIKRDEVVRQLNSGADIFTDRGFGGAPYTPLFFKLYNGGDCLGEIHHATIKKLIDDEIINSRENESGTGKYKLRA